MTGTVSAIATVLQLHKVQQHLHQQLCACMPTYVYSRHMTVNAGVNKPWQHDGSDLKYNCRAITKTPECKAQLQIRQTQIALHANRFKRQHIVQQV